MINHKERITKVINSDAYILVSGTITVTESGDCDTAEQVDERRKGVIFKNCAPLLTA